MRQLDKCVTHQWPIILINHKQQKLLMIGKCGSPYFKVILFFSALYFLYETARSTLPGCRRRPGCREILQVGLLLSSLSLSAFVQQCPEAPSGVLGLPVLFSNFLVFALFFCSFFYVLYYKKI